MKTQYLIFFFFTILVFSCDYNSKNNNLTPPEKESVYPIAEIFNFNEARQFDFWIGEWDVNLRIRKPDFSWEDKIQAHAKIYSVLEGKAILELWNSESIKGFSIRYFDTEKKKWMLWLNWPGKERSGISNLEGAFRHGRGVFSGSYEINKGETVIYDYTFSDIGPKSLRWDDAYSYDGGKTWSNNWIMEFSRIKEFSEPNIIAHPAHTYDDDSWCASEPFEMLNAFVGEWQGEVITIRDGESINTVATLKGHKITNGCALLLFLEYGGHKEVHLQTFNTILKKWEQSVLNNKADSGLEVFHGDYTDQSIVTMFNDSITTKKQIWHLDPKNQKVDYELYDLKDSKDSIWVLSQKGVFSKN